MKSFITMRVVFFLAFFSFGCSIAISQVITIPITRWQGETMDVDTALDHALKSSSLTHKGSPFHAVMDIGSTGEPYSGRIEVWWVNAKKYHLVITSPKFSQTKIVNHDQTQESDTGDYYPRWLENFVLGILDPIPVEKNFKGRNGGFRIGENVHNSCMTRDDRTDGRTDWFTWGVLCMQGKEPRLESVLTMNLSINYSDWQSFNSKQIPRTYSTSVLDYQDVTGHLTTLEELKHPDESLFSVTEPTRADKQISTQFVPTTVEEGMVDVIPPIQWPDVREGITDGYMIVYARTDRTGQVRETAKHNSDQPGLESFGMEQALRYKFKPLIIEGVAVQMEMPLVLHFVSKISNPIPILSAAEMLKQTISCEQRAIPQGALPSGTVLSVLVSVDEHGNRAGEQYKVPTGFSLRQVGPYVPQVMNCKFTPYVVNGTATYYKGYVEVVAP